MDHHADIVKRAKIINIAMSVALCLAGLLLLLPLLSPNHEKLLIGILCVAVGAAKICGYFANDMYRLAFAYDLAVGLFALVFGVLFLVSPEKFNAAFSNSIGSYVILESVFKCQVALDARRFGMRYWCPILLSAIGLGVIGILTMISFYSDELREDVMRSIALMAVGIENAWITIYTVRVRARKKKFTDWLDEETFHEEDA